MSSGGSFWSDACEYAQGKSLQTLLISTYASHSVTVRQLFFSAAAAAVSLLLPACSCGLLLCL
jgi:hypothetical protein